MKRIVFTLIVFTLFGNIAIAQQYGKGFTFGQQWYHQAMASGHIYNPEALVLGHASLPLGSEVRIHNTQTGRSIVATIQERIPADANIIALYSDAVAYAIGHTQGQLTDIALEAVYHRNTRNRLIHQSPYPSVQAPLTIVQEHQLRAVSGLHQVQIVAKGYEVGETLFINLANHQFPLQVVVVANQLPPHLADVVLVSPELFAYVGAHVELSRVF